MPEEPEESDEVIARRVAHGDTEAFGILIERYEAKMLRYAKKFLIHRDDSKDLVQEVFVKAYVNIRSFDPSRVFSPWLYRIAHNEFINAVKKKVRFPLFSFDFDAVLPHPIAPQTAEGEFAKKEIAQLLTTALSHIDVKYREPLILYYLEELEYKEIAEILAIPISTVGVRLARGRQILKKVIQNDHGAAI